MERDAHQKHMEAMQAEEDPESEEVLERDR